MEIIEIIFAHVVIAVVLLILSSIFHFNIDWPTLITFYIVASLARLFFDWLRLRKKKKKKR